MARYSDEERAAFREYRKALLAKVDSFEPENEDVFERLQERFSPRNAALIMMQRPNTKGDVKALSKWNAEGRSVKPGEKAIYVLAPANPRKNQETVELTETVNGKPKKMRFVWVPEFDRSQTKPTEPKVRKAVEGDDSNVVVQILNRALA